MLQWIACAGAVDLVRHQRADLGQHGTRDNSSASRQPAHHRRDENVCHRSGRRITQRRLQPALLGQRNNSTLSRRLERPGAVPGSRYHDWRQLGRSKPTASYGCLVRQPADRGHDWSTIRHSPSPGGHARPPPAHACTARRLRSRHPPRLRRRATAKRLSRKHLSTARPRTHMSSSHQIAPPNDMQGTGSTPHHIAFPPPVTCVEHRGAQWQCLQACALLCQQPPRFSFAFFFFSVAPPSLVLRYRV